MNRNTKVPEDLWTINFYAGFYGEEPSPTDTFTPDATFEVMGNFVWEKGELFYDETTGKIIKRTNDIHVRIRKVTDKLVGLSQLPGSTLILVFNVGDEPAKLARLAPGEQLECIRISIPDGPTFNIDRTMMQVPQDESRQLEIRYTFPENINDSPNATCRSRGEPPFDVPQ